MQNEIYEAIGCIQVHRKPTLLYKLSTATKAASPFPLRDEDCWRLLVTDVQNMERRREARVPVDIIVEDNVRDHSI